MGGDFPVQGVLELWLWSLTVHRVSINNHSEVSTVPRDAAPSWGVSIAVLPWTDSSANSASQRRIFITAVAVRRLVVSAHQKKNKRLNQLEKWIGNKIQHVTF